MTIKAFKFTRELELTYDENSPDFQSSLEIWRELMDDDEATATDMVKYVACSLKSRDDVERMIDGVGYIGLRGMPVPETDFSGITVSGDFDEESCHIV